MLEQKTVEYLKKQQKSNFEFEKADKLELAHVLIEHIGEHDSELRDELIYPNLAHLLFDKHLDETDLNKITKLLISEKYLHFDLENYVEYSVLTRSFTVLQLAVLVGVHNRDFIIHGKMIQDLYEKFLDYFAKEEDKRGYDEEVGFMHSMAHAADLFAQLMKVELFRQNEIKTMFKAITDKYKTKEMFFMYDEDERFVNAIMNGLERDILDQDFIEGWITDLGNFRKPKVFPQAYFITNNVKVFLRSLYFRVVDEDKYQFVAKKIKQVLKEKVKLK